MKLLFDDEQLTPYIKEHGLQEYRKRQIFQAIYKESVLDIDEITTLSKELRADLKKEFVINSFKLKDIIEGPESTKFLFELPNGNTIETVLMFHWHQKDPEKTGDRKILRSWTDAEISPDTHTLNRITICLSSQVGCAVGCIFCVTGKLGFKKNLSWQEMIMQILYANNYIKEKFGKKPDGSWQKVRNVVFMGMGEPMLNYNEMKLAIDAMLDQKRLSLSRKHVTISTSGVVSSINKLLEDEIDVMLALSIHAPNQALREELIPMIAKRRPLEELMEAIDNYTATTGNRLFYEYIMIKDKTDTPELAHELGKLLRNRPAHLNLIPYNENPAMPDLTTSEYEQIIAFKKIVESYNVTTTVRDTLGRDVKGACGQLGYETVSAAQQEQH